MNSLQTPCLHKKIHDMVKAMRLVERHSLTIADDLRIAIDDLVAEETARGLDSKTACNVLVELPVPEIEAALTGHGSTATEKLVECAIPMLASMDSTSFRTIGQGRLPGMVKTMKPDSIRALIDLGFRHESLLTAGLAAEIWLSHGAEFGKRAFRKTYPRKNPAIFFWEDHLFTLPDAGVCPEGAELVRQAIDLIAGGKYLDSVNNAIRKHRIDPRILLALLLSCAHGSTTTHHIRCHSNAVKVILGNVLGKELLTLISPANSQHEKFSKLQQISRMPSTEAIIALPRCTIRTDITTLEDLAGLAQNRDRG